MTDIYMLQAAESARRLFEERGHSVAASRGKMISILAIVSLLARK